MTVKVYGSSDDLIEIEGDIYEEFNPPYFNGDEPTFLAFSNGALLSVRYDNPGVWRIEVLSDTYPETVSVIKAPLNDEDNYSDVADIDDTIKWVVHGPRLEVAR